MLSEISQNKKDKFLKDLTCMQNLKGQKKKKPTKTHKAKYNKRRLIDMGTNGQLPEPRKVQSTQNK